MIKKIGLALLAVAGSIMLSVPAFAGAWKNDARGWWYENDDGSYKQNEWFTEADGKAYYFGADGYMLVNTITPDGYSVDANGVWIPSVDQNRQTETQHAQHANASVVRDSVVQEDKEKGIHYVLNTHTRKFHLENCSSVKDIKAANRNDITSTRQAVLDAGYQPCKRCNP